MLAKLLTLCSQHRAVSRSTRDKNDERHLNCEFLNSMLIRYNAVKEQIQTFGTDAPSDRHLARAV